MIQTERLNIYPLSDEEMRDVIQNESNEALKAAYSEMLAGCLENPEQRIWHALWVLQLNDGSGKIIGSLSFKGLNDNGMVEIGYGINPEYEGKGLMTEAVSAAVRWASKQPGVLSIEAETEPDNIASQRVLEKAGFIPSGVIGAEGPRYIWKNGKRQSAHPAAKVRAGLHNAITTYAGKRLTIACSCSVMRKNQRKGDIIRKTFADV